jgi:hypothetical protein
MANQTTVATPGIVTSLFQHPDGLRLDFDDWTLTITDADDRRASMPIGPLGLIELGNTLLALGRGLGGGL